MGVGADGERVRSVLFKKPAINAAASSSLTGVATEAASSTSSKPKGKANFHFAPESPGISPNLVTFAPNLELLPPPTQASKASDNDDVFSSRKQLVRYSNSADDVINGKNKIKHIHPTAKTIFNRLDLEEPSFSIDLTFEDSDEEESF